MTALLDDIAALCEPRFDWTREEVAAIHDAPFADLLAGPVETGLTKGGDVV